MDWFKALSLGFDVINLGQLNQTRKHLKGMESAQAASQLTEELLAMLRNLYFATNQSAQALDEQLPVESQKVFVGARLLEWRLEDMGVNPEIFPSFEDKEYAAKTHKTIKRLIKLSSEKLSQEQVQDAEECIDSILEMPALNDAIEIMKAREAIQPLNQELNTVDSDWKPLKKMKDRRMLIGLLVALGGPVFICIGGSIFMPLTQSIFGNSEFGSIVGLGQIVFQFLLVGAAFIGGAIYAFKSPSKSFTKLQQQRYTIQKKIATITPRKSLHVNFESMTSDELIHLRTSRQGFIEKILGGTDDDYDMVFLTE